MIRVTLLLAACGQPMNTGELVPTEDPAHVPVEMNVGGTYTLRADGYETEPIEGNTQLMVSSVEDATIVYVLPDGRVLTLSYLGELLPDE